MKRPQHPQEPPIAEGVTSALVRAAERKAMGFCLTTHPVAAGAADLTAGEAPLAMGADMRPGDFATLACCCTRVLEKVTRSGDWMAILWLEDDRTRREAVCFPRAWREIGELVEDAAKASQDVLLLDVEAGGDGKLLVNGARLLYPPELPPDDGPELGDFVVVDVETCADGSDGKMDVSAHRVVEVGLAIFRAIPAGQRVGGQTHRLSAKLSRLVDPGRPIDAVTRSVHGITDEMVAGQLTFSGRARKLGALLDYPVAVFAPDGTQNPAPTVVTYRGRGFDLPVLAAEFARAEVPLPEAARDPALSVDVYDFIRHRYAGDRKRPASKRLGDQCAYFGVRLGQAHRAADDAEATGWLLLTLRAAGRAPRSVARLRGGR